MKRTLIVLAAAVLLSPSAQAQTRVQCNGLDTVNPATVSNPMPAQVDVAGAAASASNPLPVQTSQGGTALGATNGLPVQITDGAAVNGVGHPVFVTPNGVAVANCTNISGSIGGTAGTVTLANASTRIVIVNTHATQLLYVNFKTTAVADATAFAIPAAGGKLEVTFPAAVTTFSVIGSGSSTTYSVFAD